MGWSMWRWLQGVLWNLPQEGALVIESATVYVSADRLYALELRSGKVLGKWPLPEASRAGSGAGYALTVKDGVMYVGPRWTDAQKQGQTQSEDIQQKVGTTQQ